MRILLAGGLVYSTLLLIDFANVRSSLSLQTIFTDSSRVLILIEFFKDILNDPIRILIGWGAEGWSDPYFKQEPHNVFFHFVSMFGVIPALLHFSLFIFLFSKINNTFYNEYFRSIALGILPYFMFHTISTERHNIFFFSLIITMKIFAIEKENINKSNYYN